MRSPFADLDQFLDPVSGSILAVRFQQSEPRDVGGHSHEQGQLLGSLEGLLQVEAASARFVIPATHAIWLPPHCVHGARSPGPFAGWSIYVAHRFCQSLPTTPRTLKVSPLLNEAVRRASSWGRPAKNAAEERLAAVILDEIDSLPIAHLGLAFPGEPRTARVATGIIADLADRRGLNFWAGEVALSPKTLSRRFHAQTGFTFVEWRLRAKVLRAIELLAQGQSVTEVAFSLGYSNVSAFINGFRKIMGVSPGRFEAIEG